MEQHAKGMRWTWTGICLIVLFGAAGCGEGWNKAKAARTAAELFVLDDAAFAQFLHGVGRDHVQGEARAQLRAEWEQKTLFARAAMVEGIEQEADYQSARLQFEREALAQRYVDKMLRERATNVVLKPAYAAQKNELAVEEIHLAGLFVATPDAGGDSNVTSDTLLKALKEGSDFAALAKEHSRDGATAQRGGDMGWLPVEVAVQRFGEVVRDAEPGAVLGPIAATRGAYLIKVMEPKRTRVPEFPDVRRQLLEQQRVPLVVELEKELRAKMGDMR